MSYRVALPPFAKLVDSIGPYDIFEVRNGVLTEKYKVFHWDRACWCQAMRHRFAIGLIVGDERKEEYCHELPEIDLPDIGDQSQNVLDQELRQIVNLALSELESLGIQADKKNAESYYQSHDYIDLRGNSLNSLNSLNEDCEDDDLCDFSYLLTHFEYDYDLLPVYCYSQPDEIRASRVTYAFDVLKSASKLRSGISLRRDLFKSELEHSMEVIQGATLEGSRVASTLTDLFHLAFDMGFAKSSLKLREHEADFFRGESVRCQLDKNRKNSKDAKNERALELSKKYAEISKANPHLKRISINKRVALAILGAESMYKTVERSVTKDGDPILK